MKKIINTTALLGLKTIEASEMRTINGGNRPMTFDSFEALFEEIDKTDPIDEERLIFLDNHFMSLLGRVKVIS